MSPGRRHAVLAEVIAELERRFGAGVVYRLAQARPKVSEVALSTGSLGVDWASGIGGVPRGRLTLFTGPESSGKTTLAYHVLASGQRDAGLAVLLDAEGSADAESLSHCGVDLDDLIMAVPSSQIEALEMAEILIRSRALDALVLTSIFAFEPTRRLGPGSLGRAPGALWARLNSFLKAAPTALVFVLPPLPTAPSRGLRHYASLRLDFAPRQLLFQPGGDVAGLRARATVTKNKLAEPGRHVELDFRLDRGLDRAAELFDLGHRWGLIASDPLGFIWNGLTLGRGRERAIAWLARDRALAGELESAVGAISRQPSAVSRQPATIKPENNRVRVQALGGLGEGAASEIAGIAVEPSAAVVAR